MNEKFCTKDISLKLKELGFDDKCFGYYNECGKFKLSEVISGSDDLPFYYKNSKAEVWLASIFTSKSKRKMVCCAPLWQDAIDWLREKHQLHVEIQSPDYPNETNFNWTIHKINFFGELGDGSNSDYFICREQAILKAIELCQKK